MDGARFDTLTRGLCDTRSRRQTLAATLGGALGMALAASSVSDVAAKKKCPPCKRRKKGKCKKKLPNGTVCRDGTCQNGRCIGLCVGQPDDTACGIGQQCCDENCVAECAANEQRDPVTCGCCLRAGEPCDDPTACCAKECVAIIGEPPVCSALD
jgi:hypothetical protein